MNIQDAIGKGFGSIERSYYIGVNDYFGLRRTNIPHVTPNYETVKYKYEVEYSRQTYCSQESLFLYK